MKDQRRSRDLLERRAERLDELVRQLAHEPHRVRERRGAAAREPDPPHRGVQGREELIGDQHVRTRERVHERRLPGVGVAGDRDLGDAGALTPGTLHLARAGEVLQILTKLGDPTADVLAVDLQLGLAGTARPDATAEPAHRLAPPAEPGQEVVELRELDLRLALPAPGVQGEDVQDQRRPVHDLDLQPLLEVSQLARRQLVVKDHRPGTGAVHRLVDLLQLALADERGGVRVLARLEDPRDRVRPGAVGEGRELVEVGLLDPAADADEHGLLGDAGPPRGRERRLERAGLVDAAGSLPSILRHQTRISPRRCIAWARRSSGTVSERRTYPSPRTPYPFPGATNTPASSRSRSANPTDVSPVGTGAHT